MKKTYAELAEEYYNWFEVVAVTREGKEEHIVTLKDGAPEELADLVRKAHSEFLPDDFRYDQIHNALDSIGESGAEEPDEYDPYAQDLEPDVYNWDLLKWVGSNLARASYVDEAVEEYGWNDNQGISGAIGLGQLKEKEEIYSQVHAALTKIWEEIEEEEE